MVMLKPSDFDLISSELILLLFFSLHRMCVGGESKCPYAKYLLLNFLQIGGIQKLIEVVNDVSWKV